MPDILFRFVRQVASLSKNSLTQHCWSWVI